MGPALGAAEIREMQIGRLNQQVLGPNAFKELSEKLPGLTDEQVRTLHDTYYANLTPTFKGSFHETRDQNRYPTYTFDEKAFKQATSASDALAVAPAVSSRQTAEKFTANAINAKQTAPKPAAVDPTKTSKGNIANSPEVDGRDNVRKTPVQKKTPVHSADPSKKKPAATGEKPKTPADNGYGKASGEEKANLLMDAHRMLNSDPRAALAGLQEETAQGDALRAAYDARTKADPNFARDFTDRYSAQITVGIPHGGTLSPTGGHMANGNGLAAKGTGHHRHSLKAEDANRIIPGHSGAPDSIQATSLSPPASQTAAPSSEKPPLQQQQYNDFAKSAGSAAPKGVPVPSF
ncbi:MAG: hypothetical protein AB7H77_02345 [Bdellovibrionales bacterium]